MLKLLLGEVKRNSCMCACYGSYYLTFIQQLVDARFESGNQRQSGHAKVDEAKSMSAEARIPIDNGCLYMT